MYKTQIKQLISRAKMKPIGAIPVGLKVSFGGAKVAVEAQYEITGNVVINLIGKDKRTIAKIDGSLSGKKTAIDKLVKYILNSISKSESESEKKYFTKMAKDLISELYIEVNVANKKSSYKVSPNMRIKNTVANFAKTGKKSTPRAKTTTTSKVSPDRQGFLYRSTKSGVVSVPKSSLTRYRNSKYPNEKFFVGKFDGMWLVLELTSGLSISSGVSRKQAIEEADRILNKVDVSTFKEKVKDRKLPKEYLDKAMMPYKSKISSKKSTSRVANKSVSESTARKVTPKKATVRKVAPKKAAKRSATKGNEGNLVYVGTGKKGNKKVYQYAYKKITKRK